MPLARTLLRARIAVATFPLLLAMACASPPPLATVQKVELERFMGDWFVVAHVPVGTERTAHNAVESYRLGDCGRIETTYAFRKNGFDGPLKVMRPVGFVKDEETHATWSMRFFWLFQAEYLVAYLDPDYRTTIIARTKRDYAWIMARVPDLPEERLAALESELVRMGYPSEKIRRVPHRWPDPGHPLGEGPKR